MFDGRRSEVDDAMINHMSAELERLKKIEAAARTLYKVIKGTCAAQTKSGLALKESLGEE